jgi:hypothetical protein
MIGNVESDWAGIATVTSWGGSGARGLLVVAPLAAGAATGPLGGAAAAQAVATTSAATVVARLQVTLPVVSRRFTPINPPLSKSR